MNVVAVLQARMSSRRLPGKVLMSVVSKPLLELQIERLRRAKTLTALVVATSDQDFDDPIAKLCRELNVSSFRGSLYDVLDRYYQTAKFYKADAVVRLTADCPLADPNVIDKAVRMFQRGNHDFVSNAVERTWPQGLDVEVISFSVLTKIWKKAQLPSEREHVTLYINKNIEQFRIGELINPDGDLSSHRWTVDEQSDLQLVSRIYEALYPINPQFDTYDVLAFLEEQPELSSINKRVDRLAGLRKSLESDKEYLRQKSKNKF